MPEEIGPSPIQPAVPEEPVVQPEPPDVEDVGDFITRQVLEKDSIFFEG